VEIPHTLGLLGHSDADVLLHAIMDALLGAASLGDIGKHFADTDPQYEGISSLKLLEHVGKLLEEKGYVIDNIDATVIAQKPKLRPYIDEMEQNIAKTLGISVEQVNVKATTEEGLGFTGTEQGISAQAICLLSGLYEASLAVGGGCGGCGGCGA
jgi:2-C-methyl-D-erythritol 2,4-cyclodiphosphate synthase